MSNIHMALTTKGQALNAKIQAGGGTIALDITRIVTASGYSDDPLNLDDVVDLKQTFSIVSRTVTGVRASIETILTNWGNSATGEAPVKEGYLLSQFGCYAVDPDEGEILYRISQLEKPNYMPAAHEWGFTLAPTWNFIVGNAKDVTVTIDPAGLVTLGQLLSHNEDPNAHGNRFSPTNHTHDTRDITTGQLPVSRGGTGRGNSTDARSNLGLEYAIANFRDYTRVQPFYSSYVSPVDLTSSDLLRVGTHTMHGILIGGPPGSESWNTSVVSASASMVVEATQHARIRTLTQLSTGNVWVQSSSWSSNVSTVPWVQVRAGGIVPIVAGGTGATTAEQARANLGITGGSIDSEAGVFTLNYTPSSSAAVTSQSLRFTRIGSLVHISGEYVVERIAAWDQVVSVSGLPFTALSTFIPCRVISSGILIDRLHAGVNGNSLRILVAPSTVASLNDYIPNLGDTATIIFSGTYQAA